jgi:hypothetical protein
MRVRFVAIATVLIAGPAAAEGDWNWDIVSTQFANGDPAVIYMATPRAPDKNGENLVTIVAHYLRSAPRVTEVGDYDESQYSFRIDCRNRTFVTISDRFENGDVRIHDQPLVSETQGINPASDLGTAAEITCDGNRREALPMAMLDHDADALQKLAVLGALEKSDAGGEWVRLGFFDAAPARSAMFVDRASTGYEMPGFRTITVQFAMEQPEEKTAVVRFLDHVEVDCAADTTRVAFQAGLNAEGAYRVGAFTTATPRPASESPLIAGVCQGDWSRATPVTGIGSWVGTHAFAAP